MNPRQEDFDVNEIELTTMKPTKDLLEALLSDDLDTIEKASQYVEKNHKHYLNECIRQGFKTTSRQQDKREAYFLHALTISNPNQLDAKVLESLLPKPADKKYDPILAIKLILEARPTFDGQIKIDLPARNHLRLPYVKINYCEISSNSSRNRLRINGINLMHAKNNHSRLTDIEAEDSNLSNMSATNSEWKNLKLANSTLINLDASSSTWSEIDIAGCDITGINLDSTTLEETNFFSNEELSDAEKFTAALDRWHQMLTTKHNSEGHWHHLFAPKEHPQLKEIRQAMTTNLVDKLSLSPLSKSLFEIAYKHPMLSQHRNCTHISTAINFFFSSEQKSALETKGQETLRKEIMHNL